MPVKQAPLADPVATIRQRLLASRLSEVAETTGLTTRQLRNIRDRTTAWPRLKTIQALCRYYDLKFAA